MTRLLLLTYFASVLVASAQVVTILAGDKDGFIGGDAADNPAPRAAFLTALQYEPNNHDYHGKVPRKFDESGSNHTFGHTFTGITPGSIDLSQSVLLTVRWVSGPFNDSVAYQLQDPDLPATPIKKFPPFGVSQSLDTLYTNHAIAGSKSTAHLGITTQFDLRGLTIPSSKSKGANMTVAETIDAWGYLDVFMQDDTGIDWMELSYTDANYVIPEPSTVGLSALAILSGFFYLRRRKNA